MTKIYARQVPPEYQESPLTLWDGDPLYYAEIYGNRDYKSRTSANFDRLRRNLGELAYAWDDFNSGLCAWYDSWADALADLVTPEHRPEYTRQERKKDWPELLARYCEDGDTPAILADALTLITGQRWDSCTLRGCCQGDYQNCVYRVDTWSGDDLERLEMEYFNTGTEWIVDPDGDCCSVYCYEWSDDGIRREIAAAAGVSPEDVTLQKFTGYKQIAQYKEA